MNRVVHLVITRILLTSGLVALLGGCTTIRFDYPIPRKYPVDKNITLAVGAFENETGYSNPKRIGLTAWLDRPVSKAVRDAVIVELEGDGYEIGESPYEFRGIVHSIGSGSDHTRIRFVVGDKKHQMVIYDKTFYADANTMGVFDDQGYITEVRRCITALIEDSDFRDVVPAYIKTLEAR